MKRDGRDLLEQFRALAPSRPRISLQRWGPIRVALAVGVLVFALLATQVVVVLVKLHTPAQTIDVEGTPSCGRGDIMVLAAQSVPSAAFVPCVAALPAGWSMAGVSVEDGETDFALDSDVGGDAAVEVALRPPGRCGARNATEVPSDEVGIRRLEEIRQLEPAFRATRYYQFPGGCVRYRFSFEAPNSALLFAVDSALAFQPRRSLVGEVRERTGLSLCGLGRRRGVRAERRDGPAHSCRAGSAD